jgi:hypothetical protein
MKWLSRRIAALGVPERYNLLINFDNSLAGRSHFVRQGKGSGLKTSQVPLRVRQVFTRLNQIGG